MDDNLTTSFDDMQKIYKWYQKYLNENHTNIKENNFSSSDAKENYTEPHTWHAG